MRLHTFELFGVNYGSNAKHMVLAVTNATPSKAMQMQWLNILASIFQNIWDPEKMRIKVKAHCFFFRLDKKQHSFSWFNDNSILWRTNLAILARELGFKDFLIFSARFGSGWAYHLAPLSKMWVPTNGIKSSMVKLRIVLQVKSFSRHR